MSVKVAHPVRLTCPGFIPVSSSAAEPDLEKAQIGSVYTLCNVSANRNIVGLILGSILTFQLKLVWGERPQRRGRFSSLTETPC